MSIAALRNSKSSSAFYSGESISYAEIAYFVPETYVFEVGSMSQRHRKILDRFVEEQHLVGKAVLSENSVEILSVIDHVQKQHTLEVGPNQDAANIAGVIEAKIPKTASIMAAVFDNFEEIPVLGAAGNPLMLNAYPKMNIGNPNTADSRVVEGAGMKLASD